MIELLLLTSEIKSYYKIFRKYRLIHTLKHAIIIWIIVSPKFENFGDIMFLVAPPSPPPHANACTGHNFVTNTPIKFIFAIGIEVSEYKNPMIFGKTKWPLAAVLYKNVQKACGISKGLFTPKTCVFSAAEILLRIYQNPIHLNGARWRTTFFRRPLGPIHTKNARFFCCGNSAADLSKSHTFKWDPLADEVLEAAWKSPTEKRRPPTCPI